MVMFMKSGWVGIVMALLVAMTSARGETTPVAPFFQIKEIVVPIRDGMQRQAATLGFARSGETYAAIATHDGWVEITWTDGKRGFLPAPSGHFTKDDGKKPSVLPFILGGIFGLIFGGLAMVAAMKGWDNWRQRRETEALLARAASRRGRRILALVPTWPEVTQTLGGDTRPMSNLLREWGYTLASIDQVDDLMTKARAFQPNVLMAYSKDAKKLEEALGKHAALANTPVIYLGEKPPRLTEGHGVRLHWMLGGNDKALSECLATALRRSPKSIRHGVRSEGMRGELTGGGLWEVLHFLAVLRKSGSLHIETANLKGEVRLARGEILFARMGDMADAEAVAAMLDLGEGRFSFVETRGVSQGKGLNTEKLLLDWAKHRDEIHDGHGS